MTVQNSQKLKLFSRLRRHGRVRAKIKGTKKRPRFSVFRSSKHIYAQLINDDKGETLVSVYDTEIKTKESKLKIAASIGQLIAKKAIENNIKQVIFDKGHYRYHGRIKAVAQGARKQGLKF